MFFKDAGKKFDAAHSSLLQRANKTCASILKSLGQSDIPVSYTWRLNERHYGGLTGQNKKEAVEKFGAEQVQIWRRSFATPPPAMTTENEYFETIQSVSSYCILNHSSYFKSCFPVINVIFWLIMKILMVKLSLH